MKKVETFESLKSNQAEQLLEKLRMGIPPAEFVEKFTVGRKEEIRWLDEHLINGASYSLLLKANYGAGKTHLLELIREKALQKRFGVSLAVLDAKSGIRFNRMDQMLGAILRSIQVPLLDGTPGHLEQMLDFLVEASEKARTDPAAPGYEFWAKVTNNWRWDYSEELASPPLFVAFRAWASSDVPEVRQMVMDWLTSPGDYKNRRKEIYLTLVEGLRRHFRAPRSERNFYMEESLVFYPSLYRNCWNALEDIHRMLVASGMTGMAVLFDEFEDVLTNLNNINYQVDAFWNLFRFMSGDRFAGKTFFAVTPAFIEKCKARLMEKDHWDFDYSQFDNLPTFSMSPLKARDLHKLASRIVLVHEIAYDYKCSASVIEAMNQAIVVAARSAVQDRARQAIRQVVQILDDALE